MTERPITATRAGITAEKLKRIISRRSFCTLATVSPDARPHVVGVTYKYVDGHLYLLTGSPTKKARNIQGNPMVAIHIPVRQYPVGPPFSVQFQGTAKILSPEDPEIVSLLETGKLKSITGFGLLKEPDICFVKVTPARKMHTYGIGVPLFEFLRNVAHADRTVIVETNEGG